MKEVKVDDFTEEAWREMIKLDQLVYQETYPDDDPLPDPVKIRQERLNTLDIYLRD